MRSEFVAFAILSAIAPVRLLCGADVQAASGYNFSEVRKLLKDSVENRKVAGCSLLLIHRDKVIFEEAYGFSNVETKKPFAAETLVHLASSSKWISASAMMLLVDDGKLSLDDPIGKYLPQFRDMLVKGTSTKANPTFRQCFSHTAGFPGQAAAL